MSNWQRQQEREERAAKRDEAAAVAAIIKLALGIVEKPNWRENLSIVNETREGRKLIASRYRVIAAQCTQLKRHDLAHTILFIASEIELGIGLGPYVNQSAEG
jgi:hypothetical protein